MKFFSVLNEGPAQVVSSCSKLSQSVTENLKYFQRELQERWNKKSIGEIVEGMRLTPVVAKRKKQNGLHPVSLRLRFKDNSAYIPLGIDVDYNQFQKGKVIGRDAMFINRVIDDAMYRAREVIRALIDNNMIDQFDNVIELRNFVKEAIKDADEVEEELPANNVAHRFEEYSKGRKSSYQNSMKCTLQKIGAFADLATLELEDIDHVWLKSFERFCRSTMSVNGTGVHLRNIRTIYNDAIDSDIVPMELYPFRRFKIKKATTAHRTLSTNSLKMIRDFDTTCKSVANRAKEMRRAIDFFMLQFYLCGINVIDIATAKEEDFQDGRLVIQRSKTGEPISIKIEPEAQKIIDKYKGGKKYYLNFMEDFSTTKTLTTSINKSLKVINSNVTSYWVRHTWATIAAELDIPDVTIDMAQGRKPTGVTSVYVKRNVFKVDEANRKVLDYLK